MGHPLRLEPAAGWMIMPDDRLSHGPSAVHQPASGPLEVLHPRGAVTPHSPPPEEPPRPELPLSWADRKRWFANMRAFRLSDAGRRLQCFWDAVAGALGRVAQARERVGLDGELARRGLPARHSMGAAPGFTEWVAPPPTPMAARSGMTLPPAPRGTDVLRGLDETDRALCALRALLAERGASHLATTGTARDVTGEVTGDTTGAPAEAPAHPLESLTTILSPPRPRYGPRRRLHPVIPLDGDLTGGELPRASPDLPPVWMHRVSSVRLTWAGVEKYAALQESDEDFSAPGTSKALALEIADYRCCALPQGMRGRRGGGVRWPVGIRRKALRSRLIRAREGATRRCRPAMLNPTRGLG